MPNLFTCCYAAYFINFYLQLLNLEECERFEKVVVLQPLTYTLLPIYNDFHLHSKLPLVRKAFAKKVVCVHACHPCSMNLCNFGNVVKSPLNK